MKTLAVGLAATCFLHNNINQTDFVLRNRLSTDLNLTVLVLAKYIVVHAIFNVDESATQPCFTYIS